LLSNSLSCQRAPTVKYLGSVLRIIVLVLY